MWFLSNLEMGEDLLNTAGFVRMCKNIATQCKGCKNFFFIFDKYNGDVLFPRLLSQKDIKYNMYMFSTKSLY